MPILKVIRLTKHFGANVAGEVCGFTPDTAAHIMRSQGGELIGDMDTTKQVVVERYVEVEDDDGSKHKQLKALIVDAEPELDADGKKTGNLVEKKQAPAPEKKAPPADDKKKS